MLNPINMLMFLQESGDAGALLGVQLVVQLIVSVVILAAMWVIFTKAEKPGWAAIIPIYNIVVWTEIVGRPTWWVLLFFVPFVNFIVLIILYNDMAKSFGKGVGFTVGMILLGIVFLPMLAWGDAQYQGPSVEPA